MGGSLCVPAQSEAGVVASGGSHHSPGSVPLGCGTQMSLPPLLPSPSLSSAGPWLIPAFGRRVRLRTWSLQCDEGLSEACPGSASDKQLQGKGHWLVRSCRQTGRCPCSGMSPLWPADSVTMKQSTPSRGSALCSHPSSWGTSRGWARRLHAPLNPRRGVIARNGHSGRGQVRDRVPAPRQRDDGTQCGVANQKQNQKTKHS